MLLVSSIPNSAVDFLITSGDFLTSDQDDFLDGNLAKSNVLRSVIAQALAGAKSAVIMTTGAIVGSILAPSAV